MGCCLKRFHAVAPMCRRRREAVELMCWPATPFLKVDAVKQAHRHALGTGFMAGCEWRHATCRWHHSYNPPFPIAPPCHSNAEGAHGEAQVVITCCACAARSMTATGAATLATPGLCLHYTSPTRFPTLEGLDTAAGPIPYHNHSVASGPAAVIKQGCHRANCSRGGNGAAGMCS